MVLFPILPVWLGDKLEQYIVLGMTKIKKTQQYGANEKTSNPVAIIHWKTSGNAEKIQLILICCPHCGYPTPPAGQCSTLHTLPWTL